MDVWRIFFVLKVYRLLSNNFSAEYSNSFEHAKNWFLKRRLDTNLRQVLIDIKYTRDWQLGLQKNLEDSVVKPIIFTTQKMKFSVKDLFNKYESIRSFMRICSHLLNKFLTENLIFCALISASKDTENYYEEKNNLFFEKSCCFFIHIFRKSLCNLRIFYGLMFRCKVLRPFVFYLFEVQSTVSVSSSSQGQSVLI